MDIKSVLQLLSSVENTGWKVFEIKEKDFCLRLEREGSDSMAVPPARRLEEAKELEIAHPETKPEETKENAAGIGEIKSPLVGIFRQLEGDKAVKNGAFVKEGQPVCIIEAMKLMNEVVMPEDGTIIWQVANEGDAVEYGQLLFQYNPAHQAE